MKYILFTVLLGFIFYVEAGEDNTWNYKFSGKLSKINFTYKDWDPKKKLIADNFNDLDHFNISDKKRILAKKRIMGLIGVISSGDFEYTHISDPRDIIKVSIMIFNDPSSGKQWWKKKYQGKGWESKFKVIDSNTEAIVHAKNNPRQYVGFGNVWITSYHHKNNNRHKEIVRNIIASIRSGSSN